MNHKKAIVDFSGYDEDELNTIATTIYDEMVANATVFSGPAVPMTALQTQITDTEAKLILRQSGAKKDVINYNAARDALEQVLRVNGNYVNSVAQGNPEIVVLSGYPSYNTSRPADTAAPEAPSNLRLRQGIVSGTMTARYKPARKNSTNEVQTSIGDPADEAAWHTKGMFKGGKAEMSGFTPGVLVWVRVRTVGIKGVMGAWSDPAQLRVV